MGHVDANSVKKAKQDGLFWTDKKHLSFNKPHKHLVERTLRKVPLTESSRYSCKNYIASKKIQNVQKKNDHGKRKGR